MNAKTEVAVLAKPDVLPITEILDAIPKTSSGTAIATIGPIRFTLTGAVLKEKHDAYWGATFEVEKPEGKKAARTVVAELMALKKSLTEEYKEQNAPIMAMTKTAREAMEAGEIALDAIIKPIKTQIDEHTAKETEEKNRKAVAESRRIEGHVAAMKGLTDIPAAFVSATVEAIEAKLREIGSFEYLTRRDWEEYMLPAQDAVRANVEALNVHLTNAKAREELAKLQAQAAAETAARLEAENAATAERQRIADLKERIHNIEVAPTTVIGMKAAAIQRTLDRLDRVDLSTFGDLIVQATNAIEAARAQLQALVNAAIATEAAATQAEADAAELQAFRDSAAKKKREETEAAEQAVLDEAARKEASLQAERDAQAERDRKAEAERTRAAKAAAEAKARAEKHAQSLLSLLVRSRRYIEVTQHTSEDRKLLAEVDAALATVQGDAV